MTNNLNRSPFQNDLITEPGQTGILHESSQLGQTTKFNKQQIGFNLDWMLSIPMIAGDTVTKSSVTGVTNIYGKSTTYRYNDRQSENSNSAWATVALSWFEYCRPQVSHTIMCIKCFTPSKLVYEASNTNDFAGPSDAHGKRNFTYEFDTTFKRVHTFRAPILYDKSCVPCSKISNGSLPCIGKSYIHQLVSMQRGSLYPNTFNILVFVSFAGTTLQTITHPSCANYLGTFDNHFYRRRLITHGEVPIEELKINLTIHNDKPDVPDS